MGYRFKTLFKLLHCFLKCWCTFFLRLLHKLGKERMGFEGFPHCHGSQIHKRALQLRFTKAPKNCKFPPKIAGDVLYGKFGMKRVPYFYRSQFSPLWNTHTKSVLE